MPRNCSKQRNYTATSATCSKRVSRSTNTSCTIPKVWRRDSPSIWRRTRPSRSMPNYRAGSKCQRRWGPTTLTGRFSYARQYLTCAGMARIQRRFYGASMEGHTHRDIGLCRLRLAPWKGGTPWKCWHLSGAPRPWGAAFWKWGKIDKARDQLSYILMNFCRSPQDPTVTRRALLSRRGPIEVAVVKRIPVSYTHLRAHETDSYLV